MTARKRFKRRVRDRAAKTGESYTAALQHLRDRKEQRQMTNLPEFKTIENADHGFSLSIPTDWVELPPDSTSNPHEVARFSEEKESERRVAVVFRERASGTAREAAERAMTALESLGFSNFELMDTRVAKRGGVRLDFEERIGQGVWSVRQYFTVAGSDSYVFALGSSTPEADAELLDAIAASFGLAKRRAAAPVATQPSTPIFTDRARQVLAHARLASGRLGHSWIGGEHLLLGLLEEGEGIAAVVLGEAGIDTVKVENALREFIPEPGPEQPTKGLTPNANVLLNTLVPAKARELGHYYVGTEHLLLAMLDQKEALSWRLLEALGLDEAHLRARLADILTGVMADRIRGDADS